MSETYGEDFHLARLQPEFTNLCAVLGWRIKDTLQWAPWARLVSLYGWKKTLRAIEQCAPGQRFASDAEKYCIEYAKNDAEAAMVKPPSRPKPSNHEERAKLFAALRQKIVPKETT